MLIAREISIGGCLFILYLVGLYVTLNIPLQNALKRIFRGNNMLVTVVEICLLFIVARELARWTEPGVTKWIEESTKSVVDILTDFWGH